MKPIPKFIYKSFVLLLYVLVLWEKLDPPTLSWYTLYAFGVATVTAYLLWDLERTLDMVRDTAHEFRIEARAFWFILKTQPIWFAFLSITYMFFWRLPVSLVLGSIALTIALLSITIRAFYGAIAPQIQSTWVPKQEEYTRAVEAYYQRKQTEHDIETAKSEKKMRKEGC